MKRNRGNTMERANSFVGTGMNRSTSIDERKQSRSNEAIVIVDPFSTGAHLAAEVYSRYQVSATVVFNTCSSVD